jgi:hypothetical protein
VRIAWSILSGASSADVIATAAGAIDLLQIFVGQKLIEKGEIVVAGNCEMMLQTDLRKPRRKIAANRVLHRNRSMVRRSSLALASEAGIRHEGS